MFIQVNSLLLHPSLKTKVVKNMYHYNYSQPCGCHANAIYESIPKTSRLSWRWYRTEKYQTGNFNMCNTLQNTGDVISNESYNYSFLAANVAM